MTFWFMFALGIVLLAPLMILTKRFRARDAAELAMEGGGYDAPPVSHQAAAAAPLTSPSLPRRASAAPPPAAPVTPATIPPTPEAAAAQAAAPPPSMSLERTIGVLRDSLHLMLVGESNAGKSTAAEAVLAARVAAGDQVLILDPHADPTIWRGLPAVGTGRDYAAIASAMDQLLLEMSDRYQRKAAGDVSYPPVSLFIDEWPAIQLHCKNAGAFMAQMAQEARKVGMRLVVLTQSDRVESLGLSGKGDVRENFTMLLLGNKATAAMPETARMSRPAAVRRGARLVAATVDGLDQVGRTTPLGPSVVYDIPVATPLEENSEGGAAGFDLDAELARAALVAAGEHTGMDLVDAPEKAQILPAISVSENAGLADMDAVNTGGSVAEAPAQNLPTDERSVAIRAMLGAGLGSNAIARVLGGDRNKVLEQVKRVKLGEAA